MRFITTLLILLFVSISSFGQSNGKNDWQKRNLNGKVKTIVEVLNDSKKDYQLDSFDTEGYLIKSICVNEPIYVNDPNDDTPSTITTSDSAYISKYTTIFYYDKEHHLLKQTSANTLEDYVETILYKYNDKGQQIETLIDNTVVKFITQFEYDKEGKVVIEKINEFGKLDSSISRQQKITFKYNNKSQLAEINTSHGTKDATESANVFYKMYEYFGMGMEGYFAGKAIIKYDAAGRIIEQDIFDYKGKPDGKITCKYDECGNINYMKQYIFGKPSVSLITYKYDIHNNWVTKAYSKDLVYARTITYY